MVIRQVLKNGGFAGFLEGYNPYTIPDEQLAAKTTGMVLVRILPTGLGSTAADPGGWLWILLWGGLLAWLLRRRAHHQR
jgi:hypothetical protein